MFPTADMVVTHAMQRIIAGDHDAIEGLEPFYIKKTDAERLYDKKNARQRP
jgi:hypothetical protein